MSLRLAVATEDFGLPLRRAILQAAECRVSGIRLNARSELLAADVSASALRQILLFTGEHRMQIAGLVCPTRHGLHDSAYLDERLALIRRAMELVRPLGCTDLIVRCGRIPNPDESAQISEPDVDVDNKVNPFSFTVPNAAPKRSLASEFSLLCEILNDLTQHGNHFGCCLTLQLADYNVPMVSRLLSEVKRGPLRLVFDTATAVLTGARVATAFRSLFPSIGFVRARDAQSGVDGAGIEVRMGDGQVNWLEVVPLLVEAEYSGWVCVERTGGDARPEDVRHGVSHLRALLPVIPG